MSNEQNNPADDIEQVVGLHQAGAMRRHLKLWIGAAVALTLLVLLVMFFKSNNDTTIQFKTVEAQTGDLTVTVTATGELEPVNQVEVGTEVSGTILSVEADYNDEVKVGQVLARLDTDQLEARFRQSEAALNLAQARVKEAEATVTETRNKNRRSKELAKSGLCSQEECDVAEAAYKRAEAALSSARAQVTQAQAQVDADRTALQKAVIHSPINGIVLKRSVEPGQTVAASFQAPVLFTLAEDLSKMELHVDIDEADVGQVQVGQLANFSVDAYPQRVFSARILKVYYAPQVVQDVVTYEALLSVDNSELLLRPGMTATADIIIKQLSDVLLVPNTALRFTPPAMMTGKGSALRTILPGPPRPEGKQRRIILSEKTQQQVWTLQNKLPLAVAVTIGASDGRMTEILDGELKPGMPVVVDTLGKQP